MTPCTTLKSTHSPRNMARIRLSHFERQRLRKQRENSRAGDCLYDTSNPTAQWKLIYRSKEHIANTLIFGDSHLLL